MIEVINKREAAGLEGRIIPIHRGTPLGNPYDFTGSDHEQVKWKVDTREQAIAGYHDYLKKSLREYNPVICDALNELIIANLKDEDIKLSCYCKPQACHGDVIRRFVESQRFCVNWFTNMAPLGFTYKAEGIEYHTSENFYQAMKAPKGSESRAKLAAMNPYQAKKFAKTVKCEDWSDKKLAVMEHILRIKFQKGTQWAEKLSLYEGEIIEWNNWRDVYWGRCIFTNEGENHLGKILMKIREEIR